MVENSGSSVPYKFIFEEQNLLDETKAILANIFRDYWATEIQKEKIITKQNYDRKQLEEKKKERYNYDNLFKNNEKKINLDGTKQEQKLALIEINNIYQDYYI